MFFLCRLGLLLGVLLLAVANAHDGLDLEPPTSEADAWNVITLCHANMEALAREERWAEIPIQASLSIQAWRFLREHAGADAGKGEVREQIAAMERQGLAIYTACTDRKPDQARTSLADYTRTKTGIEAAYPPALVQAKVYGCPMCRGVRELNPATPCPKCAMKLEPRIIPASQVYSTPGEPSLVLKPTLERPLAAGVSSKVKLAITRKQDGAPVSLEDLQVMHTEPIHLLIVDGSLSDYHHEHPRPTGVPGEYAFSFTPRKPGAYRIFADVVPRLSKVQEYVSCDLPASAPAEPISDREPRNVGSANGLRFELSWLPRGTPLRTKEPLQASVQVFDKAGKPFAQLEPVMGAYAHIVGFHEDHQTVVHLHPTDAEPHQPTDRGGPSFRFQFYAPKPGYYRLYVQVQVDGVSRFAPFGAVALP